MTNVNPENSTDKVSDETRAGSAAGASASSAAKQRPAGGGAHAKKGGLPLRGLAMVLIAVAVMLGLWALYSMTSGDDDSTVASKSTQENSAGSTIGAAPEGSAGPDAAGSRAPGAPEASDRPGAPAPAPAGEGDKPGDAAASGDADERAVAENEAAGEDNAHSAARDRNDIKVSVLNNSGEVDKAKKEADSLKGGGFKVGYVGNLPGDVLTVPKTTVFFPEGDASAEALAKEVAARYQADIAPMNRDLPKEATDDGAVVVALAVPQA